MTFSTTPIDLHTETFHPNMTKSQRGFSLGFWLLFCTFLWNLSAAGPLRAQPLGELPRPTYYVAREMFRIGNIQEAASGLESVIAVSRRSFPDGWIDLIPPHVMLGECLYQQGNLAGALEQYQTALGIALRFPAWPDQFNLGDTTLPVTNISAKGIQWFRLSFPSSSMAVPDSVQLLIDFTQAQADAQGNIIAPVNLLTRLDSSEVLRTLGIALMRRWQILGPLAQNSAMTEQLIQYFSLNLQQPHPWANQSWRTLRGLAIMARDEQEAEPLLRSTTQIRGQTDYFLSPLSLLVQGKLAAIRGEYQAAILHLQDASLLAAQYEQFDTLSEAMIWLSDCGCANERFDLIEAFNAAATWNNKRTPLGFVACVGGAAELSIQASNLAEAKRFASRTAATLRPRDVALPRFQSRLAFTEALIALNENQTSVARNRLTSALNLMRGSAALGAIPERIFQKQLTLDMLASGQLTNAEADRILTFLLAEPAASEWELQPLETLAALTTSAKPAYLRWLRLSDPQDAELVSQRMDRVQQQQLFEALPLGGRTLAWQQAISTPLGQLPPQARAAVQAAAQRIPQLTQLPDRVDTMGMQLRQSSPPLDDRQLRPEMRQSYNQLEGMAEQVDSLLLFQSISRKSLPRLAPLSWQFEDAQEILSPEDLLISFVIAGDELFGLAVNKDQREIWKVRDGPAILARLSVLYRQMGVIRTSPGKVPDNLTAAGAPWRQSAQELYSLLFPPDCKILLEAANRLIIAPHGFLWYVPFESLVVDDGSALITDRSVTYIPTMGSLPVVFRPVDAPTNALSFVNPVFSLDRSINSQESKKVSDSGTANTSEIFLEQRINAPSSLWLRGYADEVITLSPISTATDGWGVRPIPIDSKPGGRLSDWLGSTFPTPPWIFLPMNDSTIQRGQLGNGNDLLLPAFAMTYGGKLGMISRWKVGGISASRYLQRIRQELGDSRSLSGSLRRATLAVWSEQFHTDQEPILQPTGSSTDRLVSGENPLLWSAYMAIGDYQPVN